jgi:Domain of unknown function (DUF222)
LAEIPPGPRLSAVLSGIDLARLSGFDCVQVLKARYRQVNHERAQLMAAMVEVGLCGPAPAGDELRRMAVPDEFSADEIRAALVLTRRAVEAQFWLAYDLITRLPDVHAALDAGLIDEPRARVLSEWTIELSAEAARALCGAVLARVPKLTTGQLIDQIKKMAIAIDPDWAQRRYEHALAERRVVGSRNADGSANLSGLNLPVDRVAAACGHIDALAKAAKQAGDPRPIDHIRADLFLGMTDGTYTGLNDRTILERLRATQGNDEPANNGADDGGADDAPERHDPTRDNEPGDEGPDHDGTSNNGPGDSDAAAQDGRSAAGDPAPQRRPSGGGMELRVRLSTLLGHDEYPGELAGWGPVHAGLARAQATALARGQWRFAVTDEHGQLLHCGITQARPLGWPTRTAGCRQIVELQVPASTLHELASDLAALGGWAPVVTDLVHQHTTAQQGPTADPTRRFPGAALRRQVQIRDRTCIMIGCRAPAGHADIDHTLDHACGGATTEPNLGNVCRHDHRLKHDGGWRLDQPEPGLFHWRSRLGHSYLIRSAPIIEPLPDPIPRDGPAPPLVVPPDEGWETSCIWEECSWQDPPAEADTKPPPGPPPEPGSHHDAAPF